MRTKEVGYIEEFLNKNNWKLQNIEKVHDYSNELTFIYKQFGKSESAESFLKILIVDNHSDLNLITIGISSQIKTNLIIDELSNYNAILTSSKVENGEIIKTYKNETTTFQIYTYKAKDYYNEEIWVNEMMILSNRLNKE